MRAAWVEDGEVRVRDDVAMPAPTAGEAAIAVRLAGLCGTDLELVRGYAAFSGVPGHEFVGTVIDAPGAMQWVGRRVVGEINVRCGECRECRAGRGNHCGKRRVLGIRRLSGALAERVILPVENLHAVPDGVSDEAAVFAEPLAAALAIQAQVGIGAGDRVLIVGAGRLGQLIARSLQSTGCELHVVTRHARPRELLAACGIAGIAEDDVEYASYDVTIEASGAESGLALARWALRPRGTLVLKSTFAGETSVNLSTIVVDEITVVGSRCGPFAPALRALANGRVDVTSLISARHRLADGLRGFEAAGRRDTLKVLLEP